MTQDDTITPFIDLVKQWSDDWHKAKDNDFDLVLYVALQATRWGAAQELDACCEWVNDDLAYDVADRLRAARRPKPPSLKEQALALLDKNKTRFAVAEEDVIRLALESLPD
jgi:hypothetical protein